MPFSLTGWRIRCLGPGSLARDDILMTALLCDLHRKLFVWVESAFSTTGYFSNCTHELILCKEAMAIAGCF